MALEGMAPTLSGQELLDRIAEFSPGMQKSRELAALRTVAAQRLKTDIGQPYMNIMQGDADGQIVTLTSVIDNPANKYTLVDFWASWCGPCMEEVPHLKQAYDKFHGQGFEIYGVSLDNDNDKWLCAIREHGMGWVQVSDLNGFDNLAAKDYAVQSIPSNFLIDSQAGSSPRTCAAKTFAAKSPNCSPSNPSCTGIPSASAQGRRNGSLQKAETPLPENTSTALRTSIGPNTMQRRKYIPARKFGMLPTTGSSSAAARHPTY